MTSTPSGRAISWLYRLCVVRLRRQALCRLEVQGLLFGGTGGLNMSKLNWELFAGEEVSASFSLVVSSGGTQVGGEGMSRKKTIKPNSTIFLECFLTLQCLQGKNPWVFFYCRLTNKQIQVARSKPILGMLSCIKLRWFNKSNSKSALPWRQQWRLFTSCARPVSVKVIRFKPSPMVTGRAARWRCHMWSSERPVGVNSTTTRKKRAEKAGLLEPAGRQTQRVYKPFKM